VTLTPIALQVATATEPTESEFRQRMHQHLRMQMAGMYHIYDPERFACGQERAL
jgi:hypothetical protein